MILASTIRDLKKEVNVKAEQNLAKMIFKAQVRDIVLIDKVITLNVFKLNTNTTISGVKLSGIGVGNGRGIHSIPQVNDIILVLNLFGEYYYLSSIYDDFSEVPDNQIELTDEMVLINKDWGTMIKYDSDDNLIMNTKTGAKVKLNKDGTFKLFDKNNYGFESDGNGNLTIYGDVTIKGAISNIKYMDNQDGGADVERTAYSGETKQNGTW